MREFITFTPDEARRRIMAGAAPAGMRIIGNLDLSGTEVTALPEDLKITGNLNLRRLPLTVLPAGMAVGGHLYLEGTRIRALPDLLMVGREIALGNETEMRFPTGWYERPGRPDLWRIIASVDGNTLVESATGTIEGAGRGTWTRAEALTFWSDRSRSDPRARIFLAALNILPAEKAHMQHDETGVAMRRAAIRCLPAARGGDRRDRLAGFTSRWELRSRDVGLIACGALLLGIAVGMKAATSL